MSLDTLSFVAGALVGGVAFGYGIYQACKPKKIYLEHSRNGIIAEVMTGLGSRRYTTTYQIRPEEYDGRKRTDVLSKEIR